MMTCRICGKRFVVTWPQHWVYRRKDVFLCSEDCKGLCAVCGKNLNEGPCDCKPEPDPRLAVLAQLLKDK